MKKFPIYVLLLVAPQNLYATGAYLVDDGGVADSEKVQVENWYSRSNSGEDIYVSNPAYQLLPNAEFAIQETYSDTAETGNTLWPQIKYLWHKSENVLASTTLGVNYSSSQQKIYGAYAYSSNTVKINEKLDLNLYLGWQNWRHAFRNDKSIDFLNVGAAANLHIVDKLYFISEVFYTNATFKTGPNRPATQFGLRHLTNDNLVLDLIYGHSINGNNQNWVTLGVTLLF